MNNPQNVRLLEFGKEKSHFCRLIYIKRGRVSVYANANSYQLSAGDGMLIFPHSEHLIKSESEMVQGVSVYFEPDKPHELSWENSPACFHFVTGPRSPFRATGNLLFSHIMNGREVGREAEQAVSTALKAFESHRDIRSKSYTLRYNRPASIAKAYIDLNYTRRITVFDVSKKAGISESKLTKSFSEEFSVSPKQYILNKRISAAKELLETTVLSSREISSAVGFSSPSRFNDIFKKNLGMAPLEYRLKVRYNLSPTGAE